MYSNYLPWRADNRSGFQLHIRCISTARNERTIENPGTKTTKGGREKRLLLTTKQSSVKDNRIIGVRCLLPLSQIISDSVNTVINLIYLLPAQLTAVSGRKFEP